MEPNINFDHDFIKRLNLNERQLEAAIYFNSPLLIIAGAGTGKTKTLISKLAILVHSGIPASRILAITFTNKAAAEMKKRVTDLVPDAYGLWCSTFHSFGAKFLRMNAKAAGLNKDFVIYDEDDQKKVISLIMKELGFDKEKNKASVYLSIISRAKDDLMDSESYLLNARIGGNPERIKAAQIYFEYQKKLAQSNAVDFGDLISMPVNILKNNKELCEYYQNYFDYILVDEYQDTNRAQYMLIKTLSQKNQNICVVGDPDQCLHPNTLVSIPGGTRKIKDLKNGDKVISGSGWDECVPTIINKIFIKKYSGKMLEIKTESGKVFSATPNHICFARLDPIKDMYYVYLMYRKDKGYRIGITSGVRSSKDKSLINGVMVRTNQEIADAIWILKACHSRGEAGYYEQYFSVTYGIPTMVFHVCGRRMAVTQELIDQLYKEIDTVTAGEKLMEDLLLNPDFPHHRPYAVTRGDFNRKLVWFTVFADSRKTSSGEHYHRIQLVTSDNILKTKAFKNFNVRNGNKGTWRIETSRKSYEEGLKLADKIADMNLLDIVSRAKLSGGKPFYFMPASHLREGMTVPVLENGQIKEDRIKSVNFFDYNGDVYDISVPNLRNFSAGGVLVHNSIYGWRGADIRNILQFEADFKGAKTIALEQNYRSTSVILDAANRVIKHNKQRKEKNLWTANINGEKIELIEVANEIEEANQIAAKIKQIAADEKYSNIAVFYRTNSQSRNFEEAFRKYRIPYKLIGTVRFYERKEIKDAIAYLRIIVNPLDTVSLLRIINTPARGLGDKTIDKIQELSRSRGLPLFDTLLLDDLPLSDGAMTSVKNFIELIKEFRALTASEPPHSLLEKLLIKSGYWDMIEADAEKDKETALMRLSNLQELVNAIKQFEDESESAGMPATINRYLEEISLQSDIDSFSEDMNTVTLMTLHLAKGLEFETVFVTGLEEGLFPINAADSSEDDMEEERRLMYVGMTRVKKKLFLSWAQTRRIFGKMYPNMMSRFIIESNVVTYPKNRKYDDIKVIEGYSLSKPEPKSGRRVIHPVFGQGVILEIIGSGEFAKIKIKFNNGSVHTFMLKFAPIEII